MGKILLIFLFAHLSWAVFAQPCSTTNGTNCICPSGTQNCELLPDLMISWYALENDVPTEYSQTGNGVENGRLRVTGSTPNIGYGSFTVLGTDYFICGNDTIYDPTRSITTCPGGGEPTNLLKQRIYSKNGNSVTYTDRWAGGQTYHPTHGHNHVDDWVTFTLRVEDPNQPDTLQWPILGDGAKIGFCLMDLSNCSASSGHCRTSHIYGMGTVLNHNNLPNFGMGGGSYSCSPVEQGISAGYVDIYDQDLDGMWIDIPPGTCNGNYWIVAEVDPRNNFRESNEANNWTAIPITLTKQLPQGNTVAAITASSLPYLCNNDTITLTASAGQTFTWSTGATTASIAVTQPGDYFVQVSSQCGTAVSDTLSITPIAAPAPMAVGDTICLGATATLTATGSGMLHWYDSQSSSNTIFNGSTFTLNAVTQDTTVYVRNLVNIPNSTSSCPSEPIAVHVTIEQPLGITITGLDAAYLLTDSPVQLQASTPNGTFTGRGVTTDGNGNAYFSPTLAGVKDSIEITYQYTTPVGCAADTVLYVTVLTNPGTGLTELNDNRLLFYPNPAQNSLTIALPAGSGDAMLLIMDATGRIVTQALLPSGTQRHMLDISELAKGIYFLRVDGDTGSRFGKLSKL